MNGQIHEWCIVTWQPRNKQVEKHIYYLCIESIRSGRKQDDFNPSMTFFTDYGITVEISSERKTTWRRRENICTKQKLRILAKIPI